MMPDIDTKEIARLFQDRFGLMIAVAQRYAPSSDLIYDIVQQSFIDFVEEALKGRNGLVCHILSRGTILVGLRSQTTRRSIFETPIVFTDDMLGRWTRLAMTIDTTNRQLAVYLGGDPIYADKLPEVDRCE